MKPKVGWFYGGMAIVMWITLVRDPVWWLGGLITAVAGGVLVFLLWIDQRVSR